METLSTTLVQTLQDTNERSARIESLLESLDGNLTELNLNLRKVVLVGLAADNITQNVDAEDLDEWELHDWIGNIGNQVSKAMEASEEVAL